MVERVGQHRHCKNCDKAIPYKDKYCDDKCESEWKAMMKTKKNQLTYFFILMAVIFVASMAMVLLNV